MVFITQLKWLSFKQDLSDIEKLLTDQVATYAILKYALDIPNSVYFEAIELLSQNIDEIYYEKLLKLIKEYNNNKNISMVMDEEFVETIEADLSQYYLSGGLHVWG